MSTLIALGLLAVFFLLAYGLRSLLRAHEADHAQRCARMDQILESGRRR